MSLYKRKGSPFWWIKISHRGRKPIQRSTGITDESKAQEYHDKVKAALWDQDRLGVRPEYSWKAAVCRWLKETEGKATHREDKVKFVWLDAFLGSLSINEISRDVIDAIKEAKLKEAKPATVNRYLALVRSVLRRARDDWEWIDRVPKISLFKEPQGRERALTPQEAEKLLAELPDHQRDVVLFALATGMRQANILKLEWRCVDLERRYAWVRAADSKNRRAIGVPLNELAAAVLLRQVGKHPSRVFTYAGEPLQSANNTAWRKALVRAGIEDFRWHDLRHTWATWQRLAGTPTHELQRLGGWRVGAMVERYAHIGPNELAGAAARLNGVLSSDVLATLEGK